MTSFPVLPYAVAGGALLVWWVLTQSPVALGLLVLVIAVAAVHVVKVASSPGSLGSDQDRVESRARSSFPMPPERPHGI